MALLQKLVWLGLSVITLSQGTTGFVEFLAPQGAEAVIANSTYVIRWAAKSPNGRGTMALLGGQTVASLRKIREIAYSIDVAGGSFSWLVGFPTPGGSLSSFYGLNFSLDGSEGVFSLSPPFNIVSKKGRRGQNDDDSDSNGGGNGASNGNGDDDRNDSHDGRRPELSNSPSSDNIAGESNQQPIMTTSAVLASSSGNGSGISSRYSSNTANPTQSIDTGPRIGNGAIVGIVIGATAALVAFSTLIGLILYYRRRLFSGNGPPNTAQSRESKIDGKFRKAELDAEGPQVTVTRVYELDATRGIQEADGTMKPVELGSTVSRSESHVASAQRDGS